MCHNLRTTWNSHQRAKCYEMFTTTDRWEEIRRTDECRITAPHLGSVFRRCRGTRKRWGAELASLSGGGRPRVISCLRVIFKREQCTWCGNSRVQPRREVLREIFSDTRGSGIDIVSFVNFPSDYFRFEYCETIDLRSTLYV